MGDMLSILLPGDALPDTKLFFPQSNLVRTPGGLFEKGLTKSFSA